MQKVVWGLVLLLIVLHQDVWFWTDDTLVFGFMPVGLFFHACISVAAAVTWFMATKFCWPTELDGDAAHHSKPSPAAEGGTQG